MKTVTAILTPFFAVVLAAGCTSQGEYLPPDPIGHVVDVHARPWNTEDWPDVRVVPADGIDFRQVVKKVTNRSGTLKAFVLEGRNLPDHQCAIVCLELVATGKVFMVSGVPFEWRPIADFAWADDRYLVFDRWSQPHFGIHYLIDTKTMALAHACPFPDDFYLHQNDPTSQPSAFCQFADARGPW